jgi:hypothetical protein
MKRPFIAAALTVLCAAVFVQAVGSMRQKSLTYDELAYIPAGYSYVATGDFRLNPEQPPLMKLLAGAGMLPLRPTLPLDDDSWTSAGEGAINTQWDFGRAFLARESDAERLVFFARLPVVLVAMLLVVGVYLLGRDLYGPAAGLLAATLCAFDPNILAHGRLATTDLGLTCFVLLAVWAYRRLMREPRLAHALAAAVLLALALLTKFSALFLLALYPLWALALPALPHGVAVPAGALQRWAGRPRLRRTAWSVAVTGAVVGVALLLVPLGYLEPGRVDRYFADFLMVNVNVEPQYLTYFHGRFYDHHLWYYFLAAVLLKTPLALLILLGLRLWSNRVGPREPWADRLLLFAPVAIWLLVISWRAYQIGLRYVLPIYPFLFVYAAGAIAAPRLRRRDARLAVAGLVGWLVLSSLRAYPDYLPYFNELAGGPERGIEWLDDSNVDWGQDLPALRAFLSERAITDASITGMARYDPALYGVPGEDVPPHVSVELLSHEDPPPGVYAVSAHLLNRAKLYATMEVDPLRDLEPVAVLGHTIYVFDLR